MGVLALWRYPIKAMLGERLARAEVRAAGIRSDRRWVVADARSGERIANKRGPTDPRLRACRARLADGAAEDALRVTAAGGHEDASAGDALRVTLPDGTEVAGAAIAPALSELLERDVRLERADDGAGRPARFGAPAAHHDFAPLHLLTTRTLAHLRALEPETDWDPRRFRPNVVLDDGSTPGAFSEDALLGGELRSAGGARLAIGFPTPRCVVPTRAVGGMRAEPRLLKRLAAHHMVEIPSFGRNVCAGAYAEVAATGALRVGERLAVAA